MGKENMFNSLHFSMMKGFVGPVLLLFFVQQIAALGWDYEDLVQWPETCQTGREQSPINLNTWLTTDSNFSPLDFNNYRNAIALLKNTGRSVALKVSKSTPEVTGGPFELRPYTMDNFHFHWYSEHTIDGYRYPLEGHFVHYNTALGNVSNSINHKHGLGILGVMYEVDDFCSCSAFDVIIDKIDGISKNVGKPVELDNPIDIFALLPEDTSNFFVYNGSFTTPDCNEGVLWVVFEEPACITSTQLEKLKEIYTTKNELIESNNRPLQELNGRTIFYQY